MLKGALWLFPRDPDELSVEEHRQLDLPFDCALERKQAYDLWEQLTDIIDADHTRKSERAAIKRWMK